MKMFENLTNKLENILSNLFVKFSNISNHAISIALVGEPSLTSVDPFISKGTAKSIICGSDRKLQLRVLKVNE